MKIFQLQSCASLQFKIVNTNDNVFVLQQCRSACLHVSVSVSVCFSDSVTSHCIVQRSPQGPALLFMSFLKQKSYRQTCKLSEHSHNLWLTFSVQQNRAVGGDSGSAVRFVLVQSLFVLLMRGLMHSFYLVLKHGKTAQRRPDRNATLTKRSWNLKHHLKRGVDSVVGLFVHLMQ